MGKINKYANLYDKNGNKIRSVKNVSKDDKHTKYLLTDISMEELESMIDNYPKDGDKEVLDKLKMYLFNMYNTYGNPHEQELVDRLKAYAKTKSNSDEISAKLNEVAEAVDGDTDIDGDVDVKKEIVMDEYVDFEEIKEAA